MIREEKNKKKKLKMVEFDGVNVSKHYIDRYYERVFKTQIPNDYKFADVRENVLNDMLIRMSVIEMKCFSFLLNLYHIKKEMKIFI